MSTVTKTYHFVVDAEDWAGTPGWAPSNAAVVNMHFHRRQTTRQVTTGSRSSPPVSTYGGCLVTTACGGAGSSENYWLLTKTWEDLGVPAGKTVTKVNLQYSYRWQTRVGHVHNGGLSIAEFANNEAATGPAEFLDSGENLIDTFSSRIFCIARTAGNLWRGYPQDPSWPYGVPGHENYTAYPISETPPSWGVAAGSELDVPVGMSASDTTVKFKIKNLSPAIVAATPYHDGNKWVPQPFGTVRLKTDRIIVTITYTEPNTFDSLLLAGD